MYEQYKVTVPEGESGSWKVERFNINANSLQGLHCALDGRPVSDGTYTRLIRKGGWSPMMSDTEAEIRDHIPFIHRAKGRCLLNGLGLGVVLKALIAKPEVTHIDVVEIDKDVIKLVWPTYQDGERITLHHADAYSIQWPKGERWDCIWHDIWPDICTDNLAEITQLKRKYARRTRYQEAWVEDLLRYYRRQGR